jgi:4-amino-4-deoxy-L-arabinose transferase-like glycosyltransferase
MLVSGFSITRSPDQEPALRRAEVITRFLWFSIIFIGILILHAPLLRLPFFWDEAGFYVPAAHDLATLHTLVPKTTIDAGHPPLPAAYLALWLALSGWKPVVARVAMLLLAAFALTNVFLLARRIANFHVALASTIATALYPVFFVQSSLAHADLPAAAFALWGIRLGVERRLWTSQLAFSLAVLSKETAVITPIVMAFWEVFLAPKRDTGRFRRAAICLTPVLPLLLWLFYHHHETGRFFGDASFYQYNVSNVLSPLRFVLALASRSWQLLGAMGMMALTAATVAAMWFSPLKDPAGKDSALERPRIAIPTQLLFALIMLAHLLTFSLVGGALLTRYLLPAFPLVIIIGMSTLWRRVSRWEWPAAVIVIFFVLSLFFDPPYKFAPEDNLTYKDFVELHVQAAQFLTEHEHNATVLTAWPAVDELKYPYLGYVSTPLATMSIKDFTLEEIMKARRMRSQYQVAYLFSTKYDRPAWFSSKLWTTLNRRYFDYHTDVDPETAAEFLGGNIVFLARRKAEWVAIVEMEQPATSVRNRVIGPSGDRVIGKSSKTVPDLRVLCGEPAFASAASLVWLGAKY